MNILLDTHVALWAITDSPRLSERARSLIMSDQASIWVSAATLWEIAIKHALGRGDMPVSAQAAKQYFDDSGYGFLPIDAQHAMAVESLPLLHQDPFDRMLVAQAMTEPMRFLTHDAILARYSDTIIAV